MRISSEHLEAMRELISPLDNEDRREKYRNGDFPRSELTKDVNRRYRFDLMWAAKAYNVFGDTEYDDSHIYTALRSIIPSL